MAKRKYVRIVPAEAGAASVAETTPDLPAKVERAVKAITAPFRAFVKSFGALAVSREELSPKFMKAFGLWQAETGGTFVEFIRFLVPGVPSVRAEYRNHRAYQAADYLRRLAGNAARKPRTAAERASAPAPPTDVIARIMASLMEVIPEGRQQDTVWAALQSQAHWTNRQIQRLQTQVEHVDPLVHIRARVENLRLSLPEISEEAQEERPAA